MIYDNIKNCSYYYLNERFKRAFDFLNGFKGGLPVCRIDLCDGVIALIQKYKTKDQKFGKWESHNEYVDLQYIFKGSEKIGFSSVKRLELAVPYSKDKDCALYTGFGDFLSIKAGEFVVFFPDDGHMPQIGEGKDVEKVVIKIRIN
ncbi:MAG: YhcH/YjgK/YiaL family protein [Clostridia bacterium]